MTYIIFFVASFIQALGGFGAGLFAVPLLALAYEPRFIIPPFALTVFLLNTALISEVRKNLLWTKIIFITAGSFIGLPFGVLLLKHVNQDIIRLFVSAATLILGLLFLSGFKPRIKDNRLTFFISGALSGILSGTAAMGGPPLIFLMMSMNLSKDDFRANLLGCFLFNGIYANTLYFINGLFNGDNLKIAIFGFIPAVAGTIIGIRVKNFLTDRKFNQIALITVIIIGIIGVFRALFLLKSYF